MKSFFTPKEVAQIVGISYRQIQYWDKTNFIKPSYRRSGKYRMYTFSDLVQMKIAKLLREKDVSIQRLRKVIKLLRTLLPQMSFPLSESSFLIEGERISIFHGDMLMSQGPERFRFDGKSLRDEISRTYPDLYALPDEDGEASEAA